MAMISAVLLQLALRPPNDMATCAHVGPSSVVLERHMSYAKFLVIQLGIALLVFSVLMTVAELASVRLMVGGLVLGLVALFAASRMR